MIYVLVALKGELPENRLNTEKFKVWYTGVGKINATVSATLAANQPDCERMINFGTAGTLEPELAGKLLEVGAVRQRDMDARPQAPLGMTPFETTEVAGDITPNPDSKVILSTGDNFVTEAPELRSHLVDMEGYAIAKVGKMFNKPTTLIKYASDMADEDAPKTWEKNQADGAELFLDLLKAV